MKLYKVTMPYLYLRDIMKTKFFPTRLIRTILNLAGTSIALYSIYTIIPQNRKAIYGITEESVCKIPFKEKGK